MCGIFGYFDKGQENLSSEKVSQMGQAIFHRGPDDSGVFEGQGIAIGNQRLSIIDINGGHQPFFSEDEQVVVVQNGEIYNFIELKEELQAQGVQFQTQSDTEIILKGFEQEGIDFVSKLNGMFAIAIYDRKHSLLHIVRDRVGVKPLYYGQCEDRLYFSSELKSIIKVEPALKEIDRKAIAQYFQLGYVPSPLTAFKNIKQLKPGYRLEISSEGLIEKSWWKLSEVEVREQPEDAYISEIQSLFSDAVALRMRADVAFGAFLSGGVDSSYSVAEMAKRGQKKTETFNISFPDTGFDEHSHALEVSQKFETEHRTTEARKDLLKLWPRFIYHCDQPHADVSFIPTYKVSEKAVETVKMVLSGDGADELFAGYGKYLDFKRRADQEKSLDTAQAYLEANAIFGDEDLQALFSEESGLEDFFRQQLAEVKSWDSLNQYLYLDTLNLLPGNNLVKPDRMGMAVSLEARPPFMDYRLVEMAFSIPGKEKLKSDETKYLLKKAAAPTLGEDVVYRKKQMFSVPITDWSDMDLASMGEKLLLSKDSLSLEYLNSEAVKTIIGGYRQSSRTNLKKLRALISFELWLRIVVEGQSYESLEAYFS